MSAPTISVHGLSKAYRIGLAEVVPDTLIGAVKGAIAKPWQNLRSLRNLDTSGVDRTNDQEDTIWALRDVSFDVERGDVVGVIGRNGAGKSTLLKILSRITEPTLGHAEIRGRISSLLEVGTGFHPELTGRENVYMNGTILGMTKREIDRRFDEIVDFSGVERFLDTPCKRYSSGMQVRLAFAVAAHLEPEILIVDEVLAVGDAEFQRKCLDKMQEVSRVGRTVVFVSHNMAAVKSLCDWAIVLQAGQVAHVGNCASDAVAKYMAGLDLVSQRPVRDRQDRRGDGSVRFTEVSLREKGSNLLNEIRVGKESQVDLQLSSDSFCPLTVIASFYREGQKLSSIKPISLKPKNGQTRLRLVYSLAKMNLVPARYSVNVLATDSSGRFLDHVEAACSFEVRENEFEAGFRPSSREGLFINDGTWQV